MWRLFSSLVETPDALLRMLAGEHGETKRKAASLVVDLAHTAAAEGFVEVDNAHVSGVSVLTGGLGLRRFLADISGEGKVSIPTTLNSAGCDREKMEEMGVEYPDFLEQQFEIIQAYERLGVEATLSCTPYDRGISHSEGIAAWAESNAVCFSNSWTSLVTNRESGLSALATALTGYAPRWGLHLPENRVPNILVRVECELPEASDWSVLGDWIGSQVSSEWELPFGPMPYIEGLAVDATFEQRKALTAAAANHGCPMLWAKGLSVQPDVMDLQGELVFSESDLESRYSQLAPSEKVDLVVIGCPQASLGEVRATAAAVRCQMEIGRRIADHRLWVFTSSAIHELAKADGSVDILEEAGALVLKDTCPEVTPYNRSRYNHLLTNSMKAEHYLTSGLNNMPTSVARLEECVAHAFDPSLVEGEITVHDEVSKPLHRSFKTPQKGDVSLQGRGLSSQESWSVSGKALVSDVPLTFLGYVNRETGVIEEPGHPLDGEALDGRIVIFPKGSGSTVAPYVLMGLEYSGIGPMAVVNRDVCTLTMPACSLLNIPYAHSFDEDPCLMVNDGDEVELNLENGNVTLTVLDRV